MKSNGRLIIIEGVDGSGKSTIIDILAKLFKYDVYIEHLTWSKAIQRVVFDYHMNTLVNAIDLVNQGKIVILDRSFLSEYIYTKVYRPQNLGISLKLKKTATDYLDYCVAKEGIRIDKLLLRIPYNEWKESFNRDVINGKSEMYAFDSKLEEIYNMYTNDFVTNGWICLDKGEYSIEIGDELKKVWYDLENILK